jgi:hypothetical protein
LENFRIFYRNQTHLRPFGILLYIFRFGMLYQEKSANT